MAIQMTREEYIKKYGVPPSTPAPSALTPVPKAQTGQAQPQKTAPAQGGTVKMTREEFFAKYGITPEQSKILHKEAPQPGIAQDKIKESMMADTRSAETYKPTFPAAIGTDTPVKTVAKTIGNLPSSGIGLAKNITKLGVDALTSPIAAVGGIVSQHGAVKDAAKKTEELIKLEEKDTELTKKYMALPEGDPQREVIREELKAVRSAMTGGSDLKTPDATHGNTVLALGKLLTEIVSGNNESKDALVGALTERYGGLDNLQRTATNDPAGLATDILAILEGGAGLLGKSKQLNNVLSKTAETAVIKPAVEGARAVGKAAEAGVEAYKAGQIAKATTKADELTGLLIQGDKANVPAAQRVLKNLDASAIETAEDAVKAVKAQKAEKISRIDKVLETDTTTKKINEFTTKTKAGGQVIESNPVRDGIQQLEDYFRKSGDTENLAVVLEYKQKGTKGLTAKEINELARMHSEHLNAYNANGELSTGVTKQNVENTRIGLKDSSRELYAKGDPKKVELLRAADKQISDAIQTEKLINDIAEKANAIAQRKVNGTIGQKIGGLIARVFDAISGHTLSGAMRQLLGRSASKTSVNALDISGMYQQKLVELQEALNKITPNMPDEEVVKQLEAVIKSGGTKPAVSLPKAKPVSKPVVLPKAEVKASTKKELISKSKGVKEFSDAYSGEEISGMPNEARLFDDMLEVYQGDTQIQFDLNGKSKAGKARAQEILNEIGYKGDFSDVSGKGNKTYTPPAEALNSPIAKKAAKVDGFMSDSIELEPKAKNSVSAQDGFLHVTQDGVRVNFDIAAGLDTKMTPAQFDAEANKILKQLGLPENFSGGFFGKGKGTGLSGLKDNIGKDIPNSEYVSKLREIPEFESTLSAVAPNVKAIKVTAQDGYLHIAGNGLEATFPLSVDGELTAAQFTKRVNEIMKELGIPGTFKGGLFGKVSK